MAMPIGTATTDARRKPPKTRHMVMRMSSQKRSSTSSRQPSRSMDSGSARKTRLTWPPSVIHAQNAMNKTKKAMPSTVFRPGGTGCRGRNIR